MDKALDLNSAMMLLGSIFGSLIVLALIIVLSVFIYRKIKKKEITTSGTDRSEFSKYIMDEYHEERNKKNGL